MRTKDESKEIVIRECAIETIVKEGFQGLSMSKLAKAAQLSASTIYIYFDSKEDMLHKLYYYVEDIFERDTLHGFEPSMPFEQGLWLQWRNRWKSIQQHPFHFLFAEQFRHSPLIKRRKKGEGRLVRIMKEFVVHAQKKNEIEMLPEETFWALAYGPLYSLAKFHLEDSNLSGKPFRLTEARMKQAFSRVLAALIKN